MIRHCVFLNLADGEVEATLITVMQELSALVTQLDGCEGFQHGLNRDFESKSQAYDYGFVFDAVDAAALQRYAQHPTHQALGQRLVALCRGGADGIMVFDIDTGAQ
ncbi:MAG: Dabb family protein [Pseudomonadota bacterium]